MGCEELKNVGHPPYFLGLRSSSIFAEMAIRFLCFSSFSVGYSCRIGLAFESSSEIGVFAKLTSNYCITPMGNPHFYAVFESELSDRIPVIQASFAGTKIVGRLCVGLIHPVFVLGSELF
jgi:hypothetical protein